MPVEIKLKPRQLHPTGKSQKSTQNRSGPSGGKKNRATNGMSALLREQLKKEAVEQTQRNKMILLILPNGKRRFMRLNEYETRGKV